jgi:hypothetical protein
LRRLYPYGNRGALLRVNILAEEENTANRPAEYCLSVAMTFSPVILIGVAWAQVPRKVRTPSETTDLSLLAASVSALRLDGEHIRSGDSGPNSWLGGIANTVLARMDGT